MMDPILETFAERVAAVSPKTPKLPFVSTLTGTWITDEQAVDPSYWARHLRGTVRFAAGPAELMKDPSRVLLEVGPGNTLTSLGTRIARQLASGRESDGSRPVCVQSMRHPRKDLSDRECLLDGLGQLWLAGVIALHGELYSVTPTKVGWQKRSYASSCVGIMLLIVCHTMTS